MATLDDLNETFDVWGKAGDTPLVFKDTEGNVLEIAHIEATENGTMELTMEVEPESREVHASNRWGDDDV
jgi:hypothetical protein